MPPANTKVLNKMTFTVENHEDEEVDDGGDGDDDDGGGYDDGRTFSVRVANCRFVREDNCDGSNIGTRDIV